MEAKDWQGWAISLVVCFAFIPGAASAGPSTTANRAVVPAGLKRALQVSPNARHDVQIRLAQPTSRVRWPDWRATNEGAVRQVRADWIEAQTAIGQAALQPVVALVEDLGGTVVQRYPLLVGLRIVVTRDMLMTVLRRSDVVRVDATRRLTGDDAPERARSFVSAKAVRRGHDLTRLEADAGRRTSELHVALWEHDGWPYPDPAAWRERYGEALSLRLHGCPASNCARARHSPHASATLEVLASDYLEGDRPPRHLTVHAYVVRATSMPGVIEATLASKDDIRLVNMSASLDGRHDAACRGDDLLSNDVDALFDDGVLVIKSAGNDGPSEHTCTVGPPGAAATVLTVGALHAKRDDRRAVRTAPVLSTSAVGGLATISGAGRDITRRTVLDLAAQGCRHGTIPGAGANFSGCGTSFSTPTVSAAALILVDASVRAGRRSISRRPGALVAALLTMGDGFQSEAHAKRRDSLVGFNRRVGAGRLRMTPVDRIFETCVANDEVRYFPGKDGLVAPPGAESLSAVLFWHDATADRMLPINNLDLGVEQRCSDGRRRWRTRAKSEHAHDNKERVIVGGVAGCRLRLAVQGAAVRTGPESVCQRAHLAYTFR